MKPKFYEFTDFVSTTTTITSKIIQDAFHSDKLNVSKKADGSLLTASDITVEKIIRNNIKNNFPESRLHRRRITGY